MFKFLI